MYTTGNSLSTTITALTASSISATTGAGGSFYLGNTGTTTFAISSTSVITTTTA